MIEEIRGFEPLFGEWHVDALIGEGSFGKVYRIYRNELGVKHLSALKHFSIPQDNQDIVQRRIEGMDDNSISKYYSDMANDLKTEIELMKKLQGNANIVCFEDSKILPKQNGMGCDVFIRMELLTALTTKLTERQMEEAEVKKLGKDICSALKLCRENAIIHRDIKPDNIFIDNKGNYKLGDFGISRQLEKTAAFMSKKGTYNYMAPEVYKGERYGAAADIYSLGIVMYNLLNGGRVPFLPLAPNPITPKDREYAVVRRMRGDRFPLPCNAQKGLGEVVLKACAFYPYDRYRSAEDFSWAISEAGIEEHIDPDRTFAMFGEKEKPALNAVVRPVRPITPQGASVPTARPAAPQGASVPTVKLAAPQSGYAQPVKPAAPQSGYTQPVRPVNPQGASVPTVKPVAPQSGYAQQVKPAAPQGASVPTVKPAAPQSGYTQPVKPAAPQGASVPKVAPLQDKNTDKPNAAKKKTGKKVGLVITWIVIVAYLALMLMAINTLVRYLS